MKFTNFPTSTEGGSVFSGTQQPYQRQDIEKIESTLQERPQETEEPEEQPGSASAMFFSHSELTGA